MSINSVGNTTSHDMQRVKPLDLHEASTSRSAWMRTWADRNDLVSTPMSASSSTSSTSSTSTTATSAPSSPVPDSALAHAFAAKFAAPASADPIDEWRPQDFSLGLQFTPPNQGTSSTANIEATLPPAFFPSSRISFSPKLRVTSPQGIPYRCLGGMHLGVTGMCETLDSEGNVKSKRMIADFCTDLTSGLAIWKRDALAAQREEGLISFSDDEAVLGQGIYVLPLSMRIPNSERLPPSFACREFRITYTMSIALFSKATAANGTPRRLKVFSIPFHVLPSTLPSPPPVLPVLTHETKKGVLANIMSTFLASPTKQETGFHVVYPSLPTVHFSPASHASIPVSLRIVNKPLEPTDIYVRIALVRKTYVRESSSSCLADAITDEWGLEAGVSPMSLGYSEEMVIEPWRKSEEEIVSRWGYIPHSSRPADVDDDEVSEILIEDIALPLSGEHGWQAGYSTMLDLAPTDVPSTTHGDCSWFSPAFRTRAPVAKEYGRHMHVSNRFFITVEIGFAPPTLADTLRDIHAQDPEMEIPPPNAFTSPRPPSFSRLTGANLTNPFIDSSCRPSIFSSSGNGHAFPGKLRELVIPVTIGSVAEPSMECVSHAGESLARRLEREAREERGEEPSRDQGQGPEGAWICAPPNYEDALAVVPAYVASP